MDIEVKAPPHGGGDSEQLSPSQSAMCREETAALLALIKAGHNQVALRIRQTRTLLNNDGSPTPFPSVASPGPLFERLVDPNGGVGVGAVSNQRKSTLRTVRLLIQRISSNKYLTPDGKWSESLPQAKEFRSVQGLLHFALEYLLCFPVGVFCSFPDRRDDFSIVLCSADFSGARQWDERIARVCLAPSPGEARGVVVWVDGTDRREALRYLRP